MHEMHLMLTAHAHTQKRYNVWLGQTCTVGAVIKPSPPCVPSPSFHEWLTGTWPANSHTSVVAAGRLR